MSEIEELKKKISYLENENIVMYSALVEASNLGGVAALRCKVELQRIAREDNAQQRSLMPDYLEKLEELLKTRSGVPMFWIYAEVAINEVKELRKEAAQLRVQLTAAGVESDGENQDSGGEIMLDVDSCAVMDVDDLNNLIECYLKNPLSLDTIKE